MKTLIQTMFFFFLAIQICFAQWVQLNPNIPGGVVSALLVTGDTIMTGHPDIGVRASTDYGMSWQSLGLDNLNVWSLAKCGPYLLVGTFYSGIYRTSDWGVTWENKVNGVIIYSMVVDGSNVYAGTNGGGVIISTDQGDTWNNIGPPNTWVDGGLALTEEFIFAFQTSSIPFLIRKSKNSPGWTSISSPADTLWPPTIKIFAHSSSVFMPTSIGLFVTSDYGSSWIKSDSGLPQGFIVGYFSSVGDSIICIVNGDIYLSTDIGGSWHFLSSTPYYEQSTKLAAKNELIVLGTSGSGAYVSSDFGETWNERGIISGSIASLLSRGDALILGASTGGVYTSSDNGENWSPSKSGMGSAWINGLSGNESTIFAAANGGLYISSDGAITWTKKIVDSMHTWGDIQKVQAIDNLVFARAGYGDIMGWHYSLGVSTDGGNNWNLFDSLGSLSRFTSNDSLIFAGSGEYNFYGFGSSISPPWGIYKSQMGSISWEGTSFPEQRITALSMRGNLVAVTSTWMDSSNVSHNEFHLSNDNGVNWQLLNNGITGSGLDHIWLEDDIVASTSEGIFHLKSGSNTWSLRSEGLNDSIVGNLAIHSNELFVIGSSGTIWHRPISEITCVEEEQIYEVPTEFLLSQNYPNPFNPSTVIGYQLPVNSEVTLKVYDILGNEITTLVNDYRVAGKYEVEFNPASGNRYPASGIYFYQLKAGEFIQTKKMILIK